MPDRVVKPPKLSVWKFPVETADTSKITMPRDAKVLRFGLQDGKPFLWVLVNTAEKRTELRHFRFAGTGHDIERFPSCLEYIGTVDMADGSLVFHLFELV